MKLTEKFFTYFIKAIELLLIATAYIAFAWFIPELTYSYIGPQYHWQAFFVSLGLFTVSSIAFFAATLHIIKEK